MIQLLLSVYFCKNVLEKECGPAIHVICRTKEDIRLAKRRKKACVGEHVGHKQQNISAIWPLKRRLKNRNVVQNFGNDLHTSHTLETRRSFRKKVSNITFLSINVNLKSGISQPIDHQFSRSSDRNLALSIGNKLRTSHTHDGFKEQCFRNR